MIGFSNGGGTAVYVARDYMELRPLRAQLAARAGCCSPSTSRYFATFMRVCNRSDGSNTPSSRFRKESEAHGE